MSNKSVYDESLKNEALKMMQYDSPTDEALLDLAAFQAEQDYKNEYDRMFKTSKSKKDILLRSIKDAEGDYMKSVDEMTRYFKESAKKLSDEALTRGLGRSTYALDIQQANEMDKQQSLHSLLTEKVAAVNAIQDQIDTLEKEFLDNQQYLSTRKTQDIENLLMDMKEKRDETMRDVVEYNNALILDYKDYQLDKLKADRDYEIDKLKAKKSSYTSRSSSDKAQPQSGQSKLMNEWRSLTGAGKLKFYNENVDALKTMDLDTYKTVVREVRALAEMGVKPAKNKTYNYYK